MLKLLGLHFSPVIELPATYEVYDFTKGYDPNRSMLSEYGIGRFDEVRKGMYTTELFAGERNIHMGIDIAAPVGTSIRSFFDGEIYLFAYNAAPGDYGHTLITKHELNGTEVYALYGHLSAASTANKAVGQKVNAGDVIAWVGDKSENGGWNPHLHFQLSLSRPVACDMPGAVAAKDREAALKIYPDPRLVLGPLY
ncbi:MAG: peptidoglycan DD-metalloendopeptidase family protein [Bacteriovoracia bacterium]